MKKPLNIGVYLRVSTDKQVQVFEGSLDTQKYRMNEFVKNRNRESKNWGQIVEVYAEEGFSAGTSKRPQYQRMMADVRSGKINLILVSDISRLSRSVHDFSFLLKELEANGANYLSMKEQFDTSTPAGRLMINMVVNMAQFEREQTSERVSINFNSRAVRGFVNGGRPTLGFDRHPENKGMRLINEVEADQVRTIFDTFKDQGSVGKTLPVIEDMGIFPKCSAKHGLDSRPVKWTYQMLRDLLSNPAYVGVREVNKAKKYLDQDDLKPWQRFQSVKASWPAIVDEQVFKEVQQILEENVTLERRRIAESEARIFLLTGILKCGECGRPLVGQSAHGTLGVHRYYFHSYKRGRNEGCTLKRIPASELEEVVVSHFASVASRAGYFDRVEENLKSQLKMVPKHSDEQTNSLRARLTEVESEIASTFKIQAHALQGSQTAQLAAEHLESLGNQKVTLRNQIEELELLKTNQRDAGEIRFHLEQRIKEFRKGFAKATPSTRRRLLRRILDRLVFTGAGLEVYFNVHQSAEVRPWEANNNVLEMRRKGNEKPAGGKPDRDLSLSSRKLLVVGNGWGGRGRTCE